MTKRYFYSCPIASAYMAKEFGMKYSTNYGSKADFEVGKSMPFSTHYLIEVGNIYIHPDSLSLLEPREGDMDISGAKYKYGKWWIGSNEYDSVLNGKIIQRNGKPFIFPEVEK